MNILNKILILTIIIFLIDHLSDCKIIENIKSYFFVCRKKVEGFIGLTYTNNKGVYFNHPISTYEHQKDFSYNNKNDPEYLDDETFKLYAFMQNLVNVNTNYSELTLSGINSIPANNELIDDIMNQLRNILNSHGYRFNNIRLLDKINYHENHRGKEIELFSISTDVSYKNKPLGSVIMNFETFMRKDRFYPKSFKNGLLTINNVKLIDRKYPGGITKEKIINSPYIVSNNEPKGNINLPTVYQKQIKNSIKQTREQKEATQKNQQLVSKMNDSFNNNFVEIKNNDELFIKPSNTNENNMNDTEFSLIPSNVNLSSYEQSSDIVSSTNINNI